MSDFSTDWPGWLVKPSWLEGGWPTSLPGSQPDTFRGGLLVDRLSPSLLVLLTRFSLPLNGPIKSSWIYLFWPARHLFILTLTKKDSALISIEGRFLNAGNWNPYFGESDKILFVILVNIIEPGSRTSGHYFCLGTMYVADNKLVSVTRFKFLTDWPFDVARFVKSLYINLTRENVVLKWHRNYWKHSLKILPTYWGTPKQCPN